MEVDHRACESLPSIFGHMEIPSWGICFSYQNRKEHFGMTTKNSGRTVSGRLTFFVTFWW